MATLSDKRTPSMFVIAGVNGAGKSTLYEVHPELFSNTERINADEVVYIYDNSTAFQLVAVESKR